MSLIITSTAPAYGGYAIGRSDNKIIFIEGVIPGETAEIDIVKSHKDFSYGTVKKIIEPSGSRCEPLCPSYGICGGCHLQYIDPVKQISLKDEIISDSLKRIGKIEMPLESPITGSHWHYRRRVQFKVSPEGRIGFFKKGTREVADIRECCLADNGINRLLEEIRKKNLQSGLTEIHITLGDSPTALLKGVNIDRTLPEKFSGLGFSGIMMNDDAFGEKCYALLNLCGCLYTVSPSTFIQSHWGLNNKLVEEIIRIILELNIRSVLDLYSGAGNFSIPAALHAGDVTAVEGNPLAVQDGIRNLEINGISNCRFINLSAEKYDMRDTSDLIILDPPRSGLTSGLTEKILKSRAGHILYISCNPATLARDLRKLETRYEILSVRQVSFFPQTYHIEALTFLRLR